MAKKQTTPRKRPSPKSSRQIRHEPGDALLIIDTLNDLNFPGGEKVLPWAELLAGKLSRFRTAARRSKMPVIYVNDNFGRWRSNLTDVYDHASSRSSRGRNVAMKLKPGRSDYFMLKPMHSAFYMTSLVPLLKYLGTRRLILAGIATNLCVLFTAHDAHMHGYPMVVLSDCCAAESDFDHDIALKQLERFCGATICVSTQFQFPGK